MQKRGQVTIYIIIGLLIAFSILLLYNYRNEVFASEWDQGRKEALVIPEQAKELQRQVTTCVEQISEEAVVLAGLQGGYIRLPEDPIPKSPSNPFSNSLHLAGELEVSYWFYETANGIQKEQIPSLETIEFQIGEYIDNNLGRCVYPIIRSVDGDVETGTPLTSVEIEKEKILISTEYPVTMTKGDFTFVFPKFYAQLNYHLGELHETAKEIMESENEDRYLEEKTIDYLVLYEDIPFSGTEMTCDTKLWTKPNVKKALKEVLAANVPTIKVKGSENSDGSKYDTWSTKADPSGIKVSLRHYEDWPLTMEVFPSEGEILRADQLNEKIGNRAVAFLTTFFCITNYNFIYDVKYPVLISLTDERDYTFQFATQVIIDNNQARENELGEDFEIIESEKKICESASMPMAVTVLVEAPDRSLVPVNDATVSFKCINEVCDLGSTEKKDGRIFTAVPACINGLLIAKKEGMYQGKEFVDSNEPGSATVIMDFLYDLDLDVKILQSGIERSLRDTEQLTLYLREENKDYEVSISGKQDKVKLIPGKYTIRAYLVEESPFDINIKGKEIEKCVAAPRGILGILGFEQEKCSTVKIPDTKLKTLVKGGGETIWEVSGSQLNSANKATFYVKSERTPTNYDELTELFEKVESQALPSPELE